MKQLFALVDCDSFFVSCERLFRPDLEGRPVVVLSSNDGCAVSRSKEAKALGIPMGAPAFKYRQMFKDNGVVQFSANFDLYGDISDRLTRLLVQVTPHTEVYSVDESFMDLTELGLKDYGGWAASLRRRIKREVGIPVSIGLAPTKTLAKLAAQRAKKDPSLEGVLNLINLPQQQIDEHTQKTPINDVWGVGWRLTPKLRSMGVNTALDLSRMRPQLAQSIMGVHGRQMVAELGGTSCYPLKTTSKDRQSISSGRLFGRDTNNFHIIESAIASLTARAAYGLRKDGMLAKSAMVSVSTSRFKPGYRRISQVISFLSPTADTGQITSLLVAAMADVFTPTTDYHRADILLFDLINEQAFQIDMLDKNLATINRSQAKSQAMDQISSKYGRQAMRYAAEALSDNWRPNHNFRSPRYTTNWAELPKIGNK